MPIGFADRLPGLPEDDYTTVTGELGKGLARGVDNLQAGLGSATAYLGDKTGIDTLSNYGREVASRNQMEAADPRNAAAVGTWDQVNGVGDFLKYGAGHLGSSLPYLVPMAATGGAAGLLGAGARGIQAASAGGLFPSMLGETYQGAMENGYTQDDTGILSTAAAKTLLNFMPVGRAMNLLKGGGSFVKGLPLTMATEGATEASEEMLDANLRAQHDRDFDMWSPEQMRQYRESAMAGATVGGGVHIGSAGLGTLAKAYNTGQNTLNAAEQKINQQMGRNEAAGDFWLNVQESARNGRPLTADQQQTIAQLVGVTPESFYQALQKNIAAETVPAFEQKVREQAVNNQMQLDPNYNPDELSQVMYEAMGPVSETNPMYQNDQEIGGQPQSAMGRAYENVEQVQTAPELVNQTDEMTQEDQVAAISGESDQEYNPDIRETANTTLAGKQVLVESKNAKKRADNLNRMFAALGESENRSATVRKEAYNPLTERDNVEIDVLQKDTLDPANPASFNNTSVVKIDEMTDKIESTPFLALERAFEEKDGEVSFNQDKYVQARSLNGVEREEALAEYNDMFGEQGKYAQALQAEDKRLMDEGAEPAKVYAKQAKEVSQLRAQGFNIPNELTGTKGEQNPMSMQDIKRLAHLGYQQAKGTPYKNLDKALMKRAREALNMPNATNKEVLDKFATSGKVTFGDKESWVDYMSQQERDDIIQRSNGDVSMMSPEERKLLNLKFNEVDIKAGTVKTSTAEYTRDMYGEAKGWTFDTPNEQRETITGGINTDSARMDGKTSPYEEVSIEDFLAGKPTDKNAMTDESYKQQIVDNLNGYGLKDIADRVSKVSWDRNSKDDLFSMLEKEQIAKAIQTGITKKTAKPEKTANIPEVDAKENMVVPDENDASKAKNISTAETKVEVRKPQHGDKVDPKIVKAKKKKAALDKKQAKEQARYEYQKAQLEKKSFKEVEQIWLRRKKSGVQNNQSTYSRALEAVYTTMKRDALNTSPFKGTTTGKPTPQPKTKTTPQDFQDYLTNKGGSTPPPVTSVSNAKNPDPNVPNLNVYIKEDIEPNEVVFVLNADKVTYDAYVHPSMRDIEDEQIVNAYIQGVANEKLGKSTPRFKTVLGKPGRQSVFTNTLEDYEAYNNFGGNPNHEYRINRILQNLNMTYKATADKGVSVVKKPDGSFEIEGNIRSLDGLSTSAIYHRLSQAVARSYGYKNDSVESRIKAQQIMAKNGSTRAAYKYRDDYESFVGVPNQKKMTDAMFNDIFNGFTFKEAKEDYYSPEIIMDNKTGAMTIVASKAKLMDMTDLEVKHLLAQLRNELDIAVEDARVSLADRIKAIKAGRAVTDTRTFKYKNSRGDNIEVTTSDKTTPQELQNYIDTLEQDYAELLDEHKEFNSDVVSRKRNYTTGDYKRMAEERKALMREINKLQAQQRRIYRENNLTDQRQDEINKMANDAKINIWISSDIDSSSPFTNTRRQNIHNVNAVGQKEYNKNRATYLKSKGRANEIQKNVGTQSDLTTAEVAEAKKLLRGVLDFNNLDEYEQNLRIRDVAIMLRGDALFVASPLKMQRIGGSARYASEVARKLKKPVYAADGKTMYKINQNGYAEESTDIPAYKSFAFVGGIANNPEANNAARSILNKYGDFATAVNNERYLVKQLGSAFVHDGTRDKIFYNPKTNRYYGKAYDMQKKTLEDLINMRPSSEAKKVLNKYNYRFIPDVLDNGDVQNYTTGDTEYTVLVNPKLKTFRANARVLDAVSQEGMEKIIAEANNKYKDVAAEKFKTIPMKVTVRGALHNQNYNLNVHPVTGNIHVTPTTKSAEQEQQRRAGKNENAVQDLAAAVRDKLRYYTKGRDTAKLQKQADEILKDTGVKVMVMTPKEAQKFYAKDQADQGLEDDFQQRYEQQSLGGYATTKPDSYGVYHIYVNPEMNDDVRSIILAHEVGHVIKHDMIANADERTKRAILSEFEKFREQYGKDNDDVYEALKQKKTPVELDWLGRPPEQINFSELDPKIRDYIMDYDEWFADQVSMAYVNNKASANDSVVTKFFKELVKKIQQLLGKRQVESYIESLRVAPQVKKKV